MIWGDEEVSRVSSPGESTATNLGSICRRMYIKRVCTIEFDHLVAATILFYLVEYHSYYIS